MSRRCVANWLFFSEPNTCAVCVCFFLLRKWWKMSCSFGKEPLRLWCGCDGTDSVGRDLTRKQKQLFSQLVERCAFNERVSAHNSLALLYCCVAVAIFLCVSAPVESKFLKEHIRCPPPPVMVMITASHVWALHTLRWHSLIYMF